MGVRKGYDGRAAGDIFVLPEDIFAAEEDVAEGVVVGEVSGFAVVGDFGGMLESIDDEGAEGVVEGGLQSILLWE